MSAVACRLHLSLEPSRTFALELLAAAALFLVVRVFAPVVGQDVLAEFTSSLGSWLPLPRPLLEVEEVQDVVELLGEFCVPST